MRLTRHTRRRWVLPALFAFLLPVALAACGDDESSSGSRSRPASRAKKSNKDKKAADSKRYQQIAGEFRRELDENDFRTDPLGNENRDPFRSYVVRQGVLQRNGAGGSIQPTDVCTVKNSRAPGYSLRDLRLIGIVLRGTKSFAQFRDASGFGWIVRRGDCLGKEKAIVQAVGVGSVSLEVVPDAPPNTEPPPPERRDIPLYPAELAPDEVESAPEAVE